MLDIFPPFGKSASNITITNNVIDNTTTSQTDAIGGYNNQQGVGIYMWNAKDVLISGNVIRAEVTGIYLTFGCEGITIANNVIEQVKGKLKSQYGVYVVEDLKILSLKNNTYKGWTYKTKIEK
jgi:parallel beta-helix repeat protein